MGAVVCPDERLDLVWLDAPAVQRVGAQQVKIDDPGVDAAVDAAATREVPTHHPLHTQCYSAKRVDTGTLQHLMTGCVDRDTTIQQGLHSRKQSACINDHHTAISDLYVLQNAILDKIRFDFVIVADE